MVGEAYTVFRESSPSRFKVRVISVVRNFLPKQDVILVKAEDPRVEFSGIAGRHERQPRLYRWKADRGHRLRLGLCQGTAGGRHPDRDHAGRAPTAPGGPTRDLFECAASWSGRPAAGACWRRQRLV
jgi:hypothetical protein